MARLDLYDHLRKHLVLKRERLLKVELKAQDTSSATRALPTDLMGLYFREIGETNLLTRAEEKDLLVRLVEARNAWMEAFLITEAGLDALWEDLQGWIDGEIAPGRIIPGPPKLKPGQLGPAYFIERLHRIFARHVRRYPERPFRRRVSHPNSRLVRVALFVGLRPAPLKRYRELALCRYGHRTIDRITEARETFEQLKTELVERNLRLVLKVARQFTGGPLSFEDLVGEGNVGLMRATESFNGRFDVRFSTYAFTWIRQAILRALEEKGRTIRLPVQLNQLLRRARRQGGVTDLRDATGLTEREKKRLASVAPNPAVLHGVRSLDGGAAGSDGSSFADSLPDRALPRPEQSVLADDVPAIIRGSLNSLSPRKQSILGLRFGLTDGLPKTLVEIAARLGLSSERVRQIQVEALSELRGGPAALILEDALPIR